MNVYSPDLLASWPGDETPAQLPAHPRVASLFCGLYTQACRDLPWIATTVKGIKQHEDEDVFAQLYRRNHVLCGFATLLELPKVAHMLAILDCTLDYARTIETFGQRSMDYVVQLLADTSRTLFDDFYTDGCSGRDLSDVLLECRTYLHEPLQQWLAAPPPLSDTPERRTPAVAVVETPAPVVSATPTVSASAALVVMEGDADDEPEELHIPADRAGLVSDFCEESREHLEQIGHQLLALENSAAPLPLVNQVFRSVHTVKGGPGSCRFAKWKRWRISWSHCSTRCVPAYAR